MHLIIFVSVLTALAAGNQDPSSSPCVGASAGMHYSLSGDERITAVRTWEYHSIVNGVQLRFGETWGPIAGTSIGHMQQFDLFDGEYIVEVSGKHTCYINWLVFVTCRGRSFFSGQPIGTTFNVYAATRRGGLASLTGTAHSGLTGICAHWDPQGRCLAPTT